MSTSYVYDRFRASMFKVQREWKPADLRLAWHRYWGDKPEIVRISGQWHVRVCGTTCFHEDELQDVVTRLRAIDAVLASALKD